MRGAKAPTHDSWEFHSYFTAALRYALSHIEKVDGHGNLRASPFGELSPIRKKNKYPCQPLGRAGVSECVAL